MRVRTPEPAAVTSTVPTTESSADAMQSITTLTSTAPVATSTPTLGRESMADGDERLKRYTYTVSEAAPLIGVSERTLYRLLAGKRGRVEIAPGIVALRVSNRWVIPSWQVHRELGLPEDAELVTANSE